MRVLLKQSAVTLVLMVAAWIALNYVLSGFPNVRDVVDTEDNHRPLTHSSQLAHLVEELHLLSRTDRPKLVFFGGSSAGFAFRPARLAPLFPSYEVHCLAIHGGYGGGWTSETFEIAKAAFEAIPPRARSRSVFVFGAASPPFFSYGNQPPESHFTPARLRLFPRLYAEDGTGTAMKFGVPATTLIHRMIRPFWITKRIVTLSFEMNSVSMGVNWLNLGNAEEGAALDIETPGGAGRPERPDAQEEPAERKHPEEPHEIVFNQSNIANLNNLIEFANASKLRFILITLPHLKEPNGEMIDALSRKMERMVAMSNSTGALRYIDHSGAMPASLMGDQFHIKRSQAASKRYAAILQKDWPLK